MNHQEALQKFIDLPEQERTWLLELVTLQPKKTLQRPQIKNQDVKARAVLIILGVCRVLQLSPLRLKARNNKREFSNARFMVYNLLHQNGFIKLHIGELFSRDHSTVCYGINQHEDLILTDRGYKAKYECVVNHIALNVLNKLAS
jgi:chromosomal replication initiation ATPase DnaA